MKSMKYIEKSRWNKFVIFSDSLSGIKAIKNTTKFDYITQRIQESLKKLKDIGKEITFFWIPSHIGIEGNEKADALAKSACELPEPEKSAKVEPKDLRKSFSKITTEVWNNNWKVSRATKLHEVRSNVFDKTQTKFEHRRDQVTLTRPHASDPLQNTDEPISKQMCLL